MSKTDCLFLPCPLSLVKLFFSFFSFFTRRASRPFFFWLPWVFIAACRLSLVAVSRGYSLLWCISFSWRWLLLLWSTGSRLMGLSRCSTQALRALHQPSSFGAWPLATRCLWNLPEPEIEPMFPVLAGRFLSMVPPEESTKVILKCAPLRTISLGPWNGLRLLKG